MDKYLLEKLLLPKDEDGVNFSKATFNIPGIFLFSKFIYHVIDVIFDKIGYRLPIKYIYGSPQLKWNNGRLILNNYNNSHMLYEIEGEIIMAKERGITPLLTFSNLFISDQDLEDEKCNTVLNILDKYNCGVIVSSDKLENYIRQQYKNISIHASVIKTSLENNRTIEYYKNLSKKYQVYVVNPDDNFDLNLLKDLPKDNSEIILNERCIYQCKQRKAHYEAISKEQIAQAKQINLDLNFLSGCRAIPEYKQSKLKERTISLTIEEVKRIYGMGHRLYKLQGRTDNLYVFFFDLLRYTLQNEIVFPTIYPIIAHYIEKFLKEVQP